MLPPDVFSSFCGENVPRKILQKNSRQISQSWYSKNPRHISADGPGCKLEVKGGQKCTFQPCTLHSAIFLALTTSRLPSMPSFLPLLSIASLLSELKWAITSPKKGQAMQRCHEEQSARSKGARLSPIESGRKKAHKHKLYALVNVQMALGQTAGCPRVNRAKKFMRSPRYTGNINFFLWLTGGLSQGCPDFQKVRLRVQSLCALVLALLKKPRNPKVGRERGKNSRLRVSLVCSWPRRWQPSGMASVLSTLLTALPAPTCGTTIIGDRYDWTTGVPDNGNGWRKFLRPLVLYFVS